MILFSSFIELLWKQKSARCILCSVLYAHFMVYISQPCCLQFLHFFYVDNKPIMYFDRWLTKRQADSVACSSIFFLFLLSCVFECLLRHLTQTWFVTKHFPPERLSVQKIIGSIKLCTHLHYFQRIPAPFHWAAYPRPGPMHSVYRILRMQHKLRAHVNKCSS